MDCHLPESSVRGILQARILEWVAMPSSRGSSWPRDRTWVSCTDRWILYWPNHPMTSSCWIFDFTHRTWSVLKAKNLISWFRGSKLAHLNAEFQRKARRDQKTFLSDQCKEIEGNNRMGKTRSLQENQRYQGNISGKGGLDKGQKWYGPNRSRRY